MNPTYHMSRPVGNLFALASFQKSSALNVAARPVAVSKMAAVKTVNPGKVSFFIVIFYHVDDLARTEHLAHSPGGQSAALTPTRIVSYRPLGSPCEYAHGRIQ